MPHKMITKASQHAKILEDYMTLPEDFANQRDILADKVENLEIGSHT